MKQTPEYAMFEGSNNISKDLSGGWNDQERSGREAAILDAPGEAGMPEPEQIKVFPPRGITGNTISPADGDDEDEIGTDDENSVVIDTGDEDELVDEDFDEDEDESGEADIINEDDPAEDDDDDFITGEEEDADFDEDLDIDMDEEEDEDEDMEDDLPRASFQNESVSSLPDDSFNEPVLEDSEISDADISREEISLLENSGPVEANSDSDNLNRSKLDQTDFEGDVLNEAEPAQNVTGNDLDVPGSEMDDANERIGEEDEENNVYSRADTDT